MAFSPRCSPIYATAIVRRATHPGEHGGKASGVGHKQVIAVLAEFLGDLAQASGIKILAKSLT
jgi:hypothetical protein